MALSPRGLSALGEIRHRRCRRAVSSEADYRKSWSEAERAVAPSQSRALGRRVGIRQSDKRR